MKKSIQIIPFLCLIILALTFGILWQTEKNNRDDLRLLAQAGASDACSRFAAYQDSGKDSDYWYAVAAFRSFEQAYCLLTENTNKSSNYLFCNEVYGSLVLFPEQCQAHIPELITAMRILSQDVEDENGYLKLSELRNALAHE